METTTDVVETQHALLSSDDDEIISSSFRLHATGLTPIGEPTFAEWLALGRVLRQMEKHVHFWIGDWLRYGDAHFKEDYKNLEEITGYSYHTLRRDKYLAEHIPLERRRSNLSVAIHHEAAPLPGAEQERLLQQAEEEQWTLRQTREEKHQWTEGVPVPTSAEPVAEALKAGEEQPIKMRTNHLHQGDVLEVLGTLPTESVDLIFADPPFNIGKQYGPYNDSRADYREWCEAWIHECFRVLKATGSFYLMTLTRYLEWKMPLMARYGVFINLIIWRNISAAHDKRSFWNEYQPIMLYGKTADYLFHTYAQIQDCGERRWGGYTTEFKGQMKDRWDDIPFVYAGSVTHPEAVLIPGTNQKLHPTQMPLALAARCIQFSTDPQSIVLEPFAGMGTACVASALLNRQYIGIERNPLYVEVARHRLAQRGNGV